MIARLEGVIIAVSDDGLLLDVAGVGYEIEATASFLAEVAMSVGSNLVVWTHLQVREDAHKLYGFAHLNQRHLFRELIKINGVGPKVALAILSTFEPADLVWLLQASDVKQLTLVPGVGKKMAERLIVELKNKIEMLQSLVSGQAAQLKQLDKNQASNPEPNKAMQMKQEAISALVALGYKQSDVRECLNQLAQSDQVADWDLNAWIKQALKQLSVFA